MQKQERELLEEEALQKVCWCYYDELRTQASDMPIEELEAIIDNYYYYHDLYKDDRKDCPDWQAERYEAASDAQIHDPFDF